MKARFIGGSLDGQEHAVIGTRWLMNEVRHGTSSVGEFKGRSEPASATEVYVRARLVRVDGAPSHLEYELSPPMRVEVESARERYGDGL